MQRRLNCRFWDFGNVCPFGYASEGCEKCKWYEFDIYAAMENHEFLMAVALAVMNVAVILVALALLWKFG